MNIEKLGIWVGIVAALAAGFGAYAKTATTAAVALDRSNEMPKVISRIESKLDVVNTNIERIAKIEERSDSTSRDIVKVQSSIDGISDQVSEVSKKVVALSVKQADTARQIREIKERLDR